MASQVLVLSALPKVWILDLDGVVLRHNAYLDGDDELLAGITAFWAQIGSNDVVVVMTSRHVDERARTLGFLAGHGLRVDHSLFGLPTGERVLINDDKPSGLRTAHAVDLTRNEGLLDLKIDIDQRL